MEYLLFLYGVFLTCVYIMLTYNLIKSKKRQPTLADARNQWNQINRLQAQLKDIIEILEQKTYIHNKDTQPVKSIDKLDTLSLRAIAKKHIQ